MLWIKEVGMLNIKNYFIENKYSLGMSNVLAGLIYLFTGIILAQFTYWIYNVFMIIGIIGIIIGIYLCSTAKQEVLGKIL